VEEVHEGFVGEKGAEEGSIVSVGGRTAETDDGDEIE